MSDTHVIAGLHAVRIALQHNSEQIQVLWYDATRRDQKIAELVIRAVQLHITVNEVERTMLDRLTQGSKHQGIAAQVTSLTVWSEENLSELIATKSNFPPLLLILDGVQDPHNLGACLRIAEAVGCKAIIAPKDRSVGLTSSVCKVASGAANLVPYVQVTNLARTLRNLQKLGIWLIGATADAPISLYQQQLQGALGIVMGGEERGLRRLTRENCDVLVSIPMLGTIESLNVSVATGIVLYEVLRQRS
jgi:23S rRNA (guanosine2251-2'-O)-methyltransferase